MANILNSLSFGQKHLDGRCFCHYGSICRKLTFQKLVAIYKMGTFELPVLLNGVEKTFTSEFFQSPFGFRIKVEVNGLLVMFETDEEGRFRAIIDPNAEGANKVNVEALKAIAEALERVIE
jgi:hypothetical protein